MMYFETKSLKYVEFDAGQHLINFHLWLNYLIVLSLSIMYELDTQIGNSLGPQQFRLFKSQE